MQHFRYSLANNSTNHAMNKKTFIKSLGISALFAVALSGTADMTINLPLVGVAIAFVAAGLILTLAALEPKRS